MSKILFEKKGSIAHITLNRPSKMNCIDREMVKDMDRIWEDIKRDNKIVVIILTGSGGNFCAGFDIEVLEKELADDEYRWEKSSMYGDQRCTPNEHAVFKPVITAVDGVVNGAGTWLMLQGDIRISTPEASIGLAEVRLNFPVEFAAFLTRFLPYSISAEMLFTGKSIGAPRLYDMGVINKLVNREELELEAEKMAENICKGGFESIKAMKELLIRGQDMDYNSAVSFSGKMVVPLVNTADTRKAISGFINRKKRS